MQYTASHILMIRPEYFMFNDETALTNAFQKQLTLSNKTDLQQKALDEYDAMVDNLKIHDIAVYSFHDNNNPITPDAVFPNNWVMFHPDGQISLFPMAAESRRGERREDILKRLKKHFNLEGIHDYSSFEKEGKFLEGTGSMVIDYRNKIVYACISPRTHKDVLQKFCDDHGYKSLIFRAFDENNIPIYHTNVMMCVGSELAVICSESIIDGEEKDMVLSKLKSTGHEVVDISFDQVNQFAGNMLELQNKAGGKFLVMSTQAYRSLNAEQIKQIERKLKIIHSPINTIEQVGGGSARCMMAEIFAPIKSDNRS